MNALNPAPTVECTTNVMTFQEISIQWLGSVKVKVKESTYAKYTYLLKRHLLPQLGHYRISELDTYRLSQFTTAKMESGKLDGQGGLSAKTVRDLLSIVKSILSYSNYTYFAITYPKYTYSEMRVLSKREQALLEVTLIKDLNMSKLGILICLYTGIRIGELCALTWKNISFEHESIAVSQTLQRIHAVENSDNRTKILIDTPKSVNSVREIPVPKFLIEMLVHFKVEDPDAYFLTGSKIKFIEPRTFQNQYKRYLQQSGVETVNFHCLRHTFATRCIENGFDIKSLSEILGHANVNITLNRYVHSSFEQKRKNMEKLQLLSNY